MGGIILTDSPSIPLFAIFSKAVFVIWLLHPICLFYPLTFAESLAS